MKLAGNTILITGGGTGLGLAMARSFLEVGNDVYICGRRQEKLDEASRALPGLRTVRCDVSDEGDRKRLLDTIKNDGFQLNVLVNNAASLQLYDLTDPSELDIEGIRRDIQINVMAPIELISLVLPELRKQPNATIINVSSPGGVVPISVVPIYCASKAALNSYTKSLREQLAGSVKVMEVYPPSVDTEMNAYNRTKKISVEEYNERLMASLAKGGDEHWIGDAKYVLLMNRIAPKKTFRFINDAVQLV